MHGGKRGAKGDTAGLAGREPDHQRLVRKAGKVLPDKGDAVLRVAYGADRRRDIEVAGISGGRRVALEVETQIA